MLCCSEGIAVQLYRGQPRPIKFDFLGILDPEIQINTESSASVLFLHRDFTVRDIYEVKAYRDVTVT